MDFDVRIRETSEFLVFETTAFVDGEANDSYGLI